MSAVPVTAPLKAMSFFMSGLTTEMSNLSRATVSRLPVFSDVFPDTLTVWSPLVNSRMSTSMSLPLTLNLDGRIFHSLSLR